MVGANQTSVTRGEATVALSTRRLTLVVAATAAFLAIAGILINLAVEHWFGGSAAQSVRRLFDLSDEGNLPAWFSHLMWLIAAAIAGVIALTAEVHRRRWAVLALACVVLGIDEATQLHETAGDVLARIGFDDFDYVYSWMYYGVAFALVLAWYLRPLLMALPRRTLRGLLLAGAVFSLGAFGLESFDALDHHGRLEVGNSTRWILLVGAEESLEMAGLVILVHTLGTHLSDRGGATVHVTTGP